ncbi:MAG: tRNA (guanosine(37)-N1)-methyltransferase TrmD [Ardenticatenaceae bacterium]|nr:tRNA (guanosine(37)-N1)-methyltransferase TrmD [Ardenticatenaceae bacterium]
MRFDILTLFPEMINSYVNLSIIRRARDAGQIDIGLHNIRDWAVDKHRVTDEPPYGGGGGMVLKPEPIFSAVEDILAAQREGQTAVILMTPQGRPFTQTVARELTQVDHLILICGRYEGVDERVREYLVTDEISVGDYVLTGGELPALIVLDAVTRLLPEVLGAAGAAESDSHATGLLEGAHYTRPETFRGWSVPEVLRSGHAAHIDRWRRESALRRTWQRRPELLLTAELEEADKRFLARLARET